MDTLQYEAIKVAMKQDKEGFILTLRVHPDEVPEALLRDFVGARYQTVMVRIGDDEKPLLYTAPPQRKPLPREEAIALWADKSDGPSNSEIVLYCRAIERAHGIGGSDEA